jgi:YidC/Oxa1 family membrane protein insertase
VFTTIIVQPIFNLLVLIYALLPGHNFGLAIIIFTIIVRLLMWPLVKKQLHQAKAMRELQPELKKIKAAAKGNRQKESAMLMELYRERGINPFASIGLLIVQIPIFIGLYSCINRIVNDPVSITTFSYSFIQDLSWIKQLGSNISLFDSSLFGVIDLTRAAINKGGGIYWPAMLIVAASAVAQYYQSKQLLPQADKSRKLRQILKEASTGQQADQSEVSAAVGRSTRFLLPAMIFIITVNIASALSLYWLTSGLVAIVQQGRVLKRDETELEAAADKPDKKKVIEGEVIKSKPKKKPNKKGKNKKRKR